MTRAHRFFFNLRTFQLANVLAILALFFVSPTSAQVVTGTPPFGSFSGGPDVINLGNNNAHLVIPVFQKSGRGLMFNYNLVYDSSVWTPVASNGTTTWQNSPDTNWGWTTSILRGGHTSYFETDTPHQCTSGRVIYPYDVYSYSNWAYIDGFGTRHPFLGASTYSDTVPCHTGGSTGFTRVANDGSGYTISVTGSTVNSLYASDGALINASTGAITLTDRNGNQITSTNSSGTTSYYDTLSSATAVLTVSGSGTPSSPYLLTYTAPSGANASYTMKYTTYSIRTNFGCSGISEYGANGTTTANLVSEIDLPDSSKYTFAYEPTPGHSGFITGRLASVTLPTGGTISYSYSGGSNGVVCADGSTATLTRTTPDGAWTYARAQVSGNHWQTTIADPNNNQTLIDFQKDSVTPSTNNFYEVQRKSYQGSTSGTLLRQWTTCYNGNTTSCATTAVSSPITQKNVADQFGSSGLQCQHNYYYNSGGGLTEQDDYDYGSGAYGALLRRTLITFASLPPNITAFKQTVTVKNGSGTTIAQTTYNYDETTPTATSGITQHISVSGSRGNLTSVNYPVSGLTSHSTYYDTGASILRRT